MQEMSFSYDVIINYFSKETISDRFKYLYDKMLKYISDRGQQEKLIINEDILHQAIMDYFTDIYRLKEFHQIDHINITKIVAYEVFWLLRRKPIQIEPGYHDAKLVFANEGFLTTFIAHELLIPDGSDPMTKNEEERFIKYLQHIFYHLKYRNVDKQCLETILYSFEVGKSIT